MKQNIYAALLLSTCILIASCSGDSKKAPTLNIGKDADPDIVASLPLENRSFLTGTAGYVPAGFPDSSEQQWQDFADKGAALYGGLFGIHANAYSTKTSEGSLILEQFRLAEEDFSKVIPYFLVGASKVTDLPFTDAMGEEMVAVAKANAEKFKPLYFGVGNEINDIYWQDPDSYDLYTEYIIDALAAIKKASPKTITFTNFQLDQLKGEADLTGMSHEPRWNLLEAFEKHVDAFAFTVYPFLHHQNVDSIPGDYLDEIRDYTDKPVIITETGWPTKDTASLVQGSNALQIDYMLEIAQQANAIDCIALVWVLPHDAEFAEGGGIFNDISLFRNNGEAKPAYEYWKAIHSLEYSGQ